MSIYTGSIHDGGPVTNGINLLIGDWDGTITADLTNSSGNYNGNFTESATYTVPGTAISAFFTFTSTITNLKITNPVTVRSTFSFGTAVDVFTLDTSGNIQLAENIYGSSGGYQTTPLGAPTTAPYTGGLSGHATLSLQTTYNGTIIDNGSVSGPSGTFPASWTAALTVKVTITDSAGDFTATYDEKGTFSVPAGGISDPEEFTGTVSGNVNTSATITTPLSGPVTGTATDTYSFSADLSSISIAETLNGSALGPDGTYGGTFTGGGTIQTPAPPPLPPPPPGNGGTVGSGQTAVLTAGQSVDGFTVLSGGTFIDDGIASDIFDFGETDINSGGVANKTTVEGTGLFKLDPGGTANTTNVMPGGSVDGLDSNGNTEFSLHAAATQASAVSMTAVQSGLLSVRDQLQRVTLGNGRPFGARPSATSEASGQALLLPLFGFTMLDLFAGAIATDVEAGGFARETVHSGGQSAETFLLPGGEEIVNAGGTASGTIIDGGLFDLQNGASAGTLPIDFVGTGGTLQIDGTIMPANTIRRFVPGTTIDLTGVTFASGGNATLLAGNVLQVVESGVTYQLNLDPRADYSGATFGVAQDTATGTNVSVSGVVRTPAVRNDFYASGESSVLLQNTDGAPAVWDMNGTSIIDGELLADPGPSWHVMGAGDVNGDGAADILLQNSDGLPAIWEMVGSAISNAGVLPNPGPSWHAIGLGDFNGDGMADILWQNSDGLPAIWEMNGTTVMSGTLLPNPSASWHVIGAGDFNGDGKADILLQSTDGAAAIWEMNGGSIIGAAVLPDPGPSWHAIGIGDFNNDGKADILWQNADGLPAIWEMNGLSILNAGVLPNPGSAWHAIGTSDFNGDRMADIIWQNADGLPAVWEMNGLSIINAGVLPNPGTTWHVKDDGPIPFDQMASNATPQQSVPLFSSPDTANAVPQLAATGSSLTAGPPEQSFMPKLFTGGS